MPTAYAGTSGVEKQGPFNPLSPLPDDFGSVAMSGRTFRTHVTHVQDGEPIADSKWQFPVHHAEVGSGLRDQDAFGRFLSYYRSRAGSNEGFPAKDHFDWTTAPDNITEPDPDNPAHRHVIGAGDGVSYQWQALKRYTCCDTVRVRPLTQLIDAWLIVDGAVLDETEQAWNLEAGVGATDPGFVGPGSTVEFCGSFRVPMRFDKATDIGYTVRATSAKNWTRPRVSMTEIRAGVGLASAINPVPCGMPRQRKGVHDWAIVHDHLITLSNGMVQRIRADAAGCTVFLPDLRRHPMGDEVLTIKNDGTVYGFRVADWEDNELITSLLPGRWAELLLRENV